MNSLSVVIGIDLFQIVRVPDFSGLVETMVLCNDADTLKSPALGGNRRADLSPATLLIIENLVVSGNTVTWTATLHGAFESISGSFLHDRFQIAPAGIVDMTNAAVDGIDAICKTAGNYTFLFASATGNIPVNMLGGADKVMGGDGKFAKTGIWRQ